MSATVVLEDLAFLNLTQACRLVHLGKPTLRAAIDGGELATAPCRTKSIRIARAELERWAARRAA